MTKHALFSPSSASRWMSCPASISLSKGIPTTTSIYAKKGTDLHEEAEKALRAKLPLDGLDPFVQSYVEYIRGIKGAKYIEKLIKTPHDHCYGTADCIILDDNILHVIDLKTGKHKVKALGNKQLMIYAWGAYLSIRKTRDIEHIYLHIVQPTIRHKDVAYVTEDEIISFGQDVLKSIKEASSDNPKTNPTPDNCFFCPAKSICPAGQVNPLEIFGDLLKK